MPSPTPTLFIQGARNASGETLENAKEICRRFVANGGRINLGAYGTIPPAITEAVGAANVIIHLFREEQEVPAWAADCTVIDAFKMAQQLGHPTKQMAWGIRLALLLESDAFLFLPGGEGTLAHFAPALAFSAKSSHPKPIVLLGWETVPLDGLAEFVGEQVNYDHFLLDMMVPGFPKDREVCIVNLLDFLTSPVIAPAT